MKKMKKLLEQITAEGNAEEILTKWEEIILKIAKDLKEAHPNIYYDLIEDFYTSAYGEHFNKEMAESAVENMVFIIPDYCFNYTCEQIDTFITQSYQHASQIMSKYGKTASAIPAEITKWDKYYVYNMICADYPLSHNGDNSKISMLAYEFLSDPDAPIGKAYRYYKAMDIKE